MKKLMEKLGISIDPKINLGALLTALIGFFALIYAIFGGKSRRLSASISRSGNGLPRRRKSSLRHLRI